MEKGTDRSKFFRGEIDKYTWVDLGSSFLINELTAAFLYAQLQDFQNITERRLEIYKRYYTAFEPFQADNKLQLPCIPEDCEHNAHIFWMLLKDQNTRDRFIDYCREKGIGSVFHYIPLHSAPKGLMTSAPAELHVTDECSARLIRLPLFVDMSDEEIDYVINEVLYFLKTEA